MKQMQEQNEKLILEIFFIMKSHVTTCHYSLFVQKKSWVVHNPWLTRENDLCHWSSLNHVLSIKSFIDKKLLRLWRLCTCVRQ